MGFDSIFKRYFAAVVCLFIGIAAYFQASGMGQLVASTVTLDPSAVPAAPLSPRTRTQAAPANTEHATEAEAIINRNPFDSATGPLNAKPVPTEDGQASAADLNRDPYEDPACEGVKALLIVASEDPQWSFASLVGSDGKSVLRRQNDELNGQKVFFIGDLRSDERRKEDRRDVWDRVWLSTSSTRCQLEVGAKGAKPTPAPAPAPASSSGKKPSKVPESISSKIKKISDTEFEVERSAVDQILENQAELFKSARIVPEKEGDRVVGIRLFGIRQDSLLGSLGIENGDRLSSINGFEMGDPTKALEAYTKLKQADHLTIAVNRRGKPTNLDIKIKQ